MMLEQSSTEQLISDMTRNTVHAYFGRDIDSLAAMLDDKVVWIGSYEAQYIKGKSRFLSFIDAEMQESPSTLSEEEYTILSHEKNLYVVYGKCTSTVMDKDGTLLIAKSRLTFIWKKTGDMWKVLHIHYSDARDVPLQASSYNELSFSETGWFDYMRRVDIADKASQKLQIKDSSGTIHYFSIAELLYVESSDKYCIFHTGTGVFRSRTTLRKVHERIPQLLQIHKSYLVNVTYIKKTERYLATLAGEIQLPIGKERYQRIKDILSTCAEFR